MQARPRTKRCAIKQNSTTRRANARLRERSLRSRSALQARCCSGLRALPAISACPCAWPFCASAIMSPSSASFIALRFRSPPARRRAVLRSSPSRSASPSSRTMRKTITRSGLASTKAPGQARARRSARARGEARSAKLPLGLKTQDIVRVPDCSYIVARGVVAMAASATVRARIDEQVKKQAAQVLEEMGLSVSDAIRMMLMRVAAEKALPFEVNVPNATTARTLRKADKGEDLTRSKDAADLFRKLGI